jgi:hypothetical protein
VIAATVLPGPADFRVPTTLVDFETFPSGEIVPYNNESPGLLNNQWNGIGLLISDSSAADGAGAYSGTFLVGPHSGTRAVANSYEGNPGGFIDFRFVMPGTTNIATVGEAGLWVQNGDDSSTVSFFDANGTLIQSVTSPPGDWFAGIRADEGIASIRINDPGYFMADNLQFAVVPTHSASITVTSTANSGAGTLRAALAAATNGDTIDFALATPSRIMLTNAELLVTKSIRIMGPGPELLIVDGNRSNRVFHIAPSNTVFISGLTIASGRAAHLGFGTNIGGGIYNDHATLTISNVTVRDNRDSGIENDGSNIKGKASLRVLNSNLNNNTNIGGAIRNNGHFGHAIVEIINSALHHNSSPGTVGGALYNGGDLGRADMLILNSTVYSNRANGGAGLYMDGGGGSAICRILNSTFSGNISTNGGGAITSFGGGSSGGTAPQGYASIQILNSTFNGNFGRIHGSDCHIATSILEVGSTIFNGIDSGGSIYNQYGIFTSLGYNICGDFGVTNFGSSVGAFDAASDQLNTDPLLGPLQDNGGPTLTHVPLPGSPVLDRGLNLSGASTDQRGAPFIRTVDEIIAANAFGGDGTDIGAFEVADTNAPAITCPQNILIAATSASGAIVNYPTPTVSDNASSATRILCAPLGGSNFPIGLTTVQCSALDQAGNLATCSFLIQVRSASEQAGDIVALLESYNLNRHLTARLSRRLSRIQTFIVRDDIRRACRQLHLFIQVTERRRHLNALAEEQANVLISDAIRIRRVVSCE